MQIKKLKWITEKKMSNYNQFFDNFWKVLTSQNK